jgi:hypothetical protein
VTRALAGLLLWACATLALPLSAEHPGRPDPRFATPEQIDPAEGVEVLARLRSLRTNGDYRLDFTLENRPKRGERTMFVGRMFGTWINGTDALTRISLALPDGRQADLILQSGLSGYILRSVAGADAERLDELALCSPILEGLTISPFELQMPFIHWTDYIYEGTRKVMGRPAHFFILYPPEGSDFGAVRAVRVAVDAGFYAMLLAEELDGAGEVLKEFRINGFSKIDGQWMMKELDIVDRANGDRTRFRTTDADVGLSLPSELFTLGDEGKIPDAESVFDEMRDTR